LKELLTKPFLTACGIGVGVILIAVIGGAGKHSAIVNTFGSSRAVTRALKLCAGAGLDIDMMETSFFLSREKIVPSAGSGAMVFWRDRLFATMARNAGSISFSSRSMKSVA
jgi:KUP system potassium uptake protein